MKKKTSDATASLDNIEDSNGVSGKAKKSLNRRAFISIALLFPGLLLPVFTGNILKSASSTRRALSLLLVIALICSSAALYAEEKNMERSTIVINPYYEGIDNQEESSTDGINWHRVLGWSTIGMAVITLCSGAVISNNGHRELAAVTTAMATATCITGYYNYSDIISLENGDWQYNTHAIMGTLATIGFMATIALAGDNGRGVHVITGATSGAVFAVTMGILYF